MIFFGITGLVFITLFETVTINNESEYYALKETMEAAMLESIDFACYRNSGVDGCDGNVKISEQKFVENFIRRYGKAVTDISSEYEIAFYDIMESPPKATVVVTGNTDGTAASVDLGSKEGFDIKNALTGILEEHSE